MGVAIGKALEMVGTLLEGISDSRRVEAPISCFGMMFGVGILF